MSRLPHLKTFTRRPIKLPALVLHQHLSGVRLRLLGGLLLSHRLLPDRSRIGIARSTIFRASTLPRLVMLTTSVMDHEALHRVNILVPGRNHHGRSLNRVMGKGLLVHPKEGFLPPTNIRDLIPFHSSHRHHHLCQLTSVVLTTLAALIRAVRHHHPLPRVLAGLLAPMVLLSRHTTAHSLLQPKFVPFEMSGPLRLDLPIRINNTIMDLLYLAKAGAELLEVLLHPPRL